MTSLHFNNIPTGLQNWTGEELNNQKYTEIMDNIQNTSNDMYYINLDKSLNVVRKNNQNVTAHTLFVKKEKSWSMYNVYEAILNEIHRKQKELIYDRE